MNRFAVYLSFALPIALAPSCASDNLSTAGQMIECKVAADGSTSGCHAVDAPSGEAGTCVDIDEDGDGDPSDDADEADKRTSANATGDADDDDDGIPDSEDPDDDNDGIDDAADCDELPGGDDDDSGD